MHRLGFLRRIGCAVTVLVYRAGMERSENRLDLRTLAKIPVDLPLVQVIVVGDLLEETVVGGDVAVRIEEIESENVGSGRIRAMYFEDLKGKLALLSRGWSWT